MPAHNAVADLEKAQSAGWDTAIDLGVGDINADVIAATGSIKSSSGTGGIGYATGAGGAVTQATSKATGVTITKICGNITTPADSLGAGVAANFVVTATSLVEARDTVSVCLASGGTLGAYTVAVIAVAANNFTLRIVNITAGALGEAVVINYSIIKGVIA